VNANLSKIPVPTIHFCRKVEHNPRSDNGKFMVAVSVAVELAAAAAQVVEIF